MELCCSSHSGFQLPTGIAAGAAEPSSPTTAVRSTSTSTSIATSKSSISSQRKSSSPTSSTAAPASPSSPASTPSPPSPSSTNTIKIAIGASVPVVVIAAAAAAYFAWRRRSRRKGPRVYEKDTKGPVEIGTSNTFFQPTTKISAGDPARSRQSVHELQGISAPVHHINVHEMQ
ncbi:hypothetical protein Dda_1865 [Drechslerella dactyloides]|uniref:Uncharacterized protein n=1 Tax=Drechslerella dactyloides TaxID=74499 RepID=A0AAD6NM57_DREDA|nr:hypothetical protein Dda_1865 [Drechslerella dactyloides]